jgi:hypothetical protein
MCTVPIDCAVVLGKYTNINLGSVWIITGPQSQRVTIHASNVVTATTALIFVAILLLIIGSHARSENTACTQFQIMFLHTQI